MSADSQKNLTKAQRRSLGAIKTEEELKEEAATQWLAFLERLKHDILFYIFVFSDFQLLEALLRSYGLLKGNKQAWDELSDSLPDNQLPRTQTIDYTKLEQPKYHDILTAMMDQSYQASTQLHLVVLQAQYQVVVAAYYSQRRAVYTAHNQQLLASYQAILADPAASEALKQDTRALIEKLQAQQHIRATRPEPQTPDDFIAQDQTDTAAFEANKQDLAALTNKYADNAKAQELLQPATEAFNQADQALQQLAEKYAPLLERMQQEIKALTEKVYTEVSTELHELKDFLTQLPIDFLSAEKKSMFSQYITELEQCSANFKDSSPTTHQEQLKHYSATLKNLLEVIQDVPSYATFMPELRTLETRIATRVALNATPAPQLAADKRFINQVVEQLNATEAKQPTTKVTSETKQQLNQLRQNGHFAQKAAVMIELDEDLSEQLEANSNLLLMRIREFDTNQETLGAIKSIIEQLDTTHYSQISSTDLEKLSSHLTQLSTENPDETTLTDTLDNLEEIRNTLVTNNTNRPSN